jgi:hypothetical protein
MKISLLKGLSPFLLLAPILAGGSAQAATGSCLLSNLTSCNMTLDNVQYSGFSFTGFTADTDDVFNLEGYSNGAGAVSFGPSPNRAANTAGSFSYTATLLSGLTFYEAQSNLTGSTLGGGSRTTTLTSPGLTGPVTTMSTSAFVPFNSGLTTQTFTQSFSFTFNSSPDNLSAVGGSFTATTQGSAVPGPVPFIGAAAAFGFSRKLRSRIRSAA